jgi:hypothetical protein
LLKNKFLIVFKLILISILTISFYSCEKPTQYKEFKDTGEHGFSMMVPAHWQSESKKTQTGGTALLFSGAQGTEEYDTTINIQIIKRSAEDTLTDQAQHLADQWNTAPKYELIAYDDATLNDHPAVRLVATYQIPGGEDIMKQDQVIVKREKFFFWIGYTAPENLFEKYQEHFEKALGSFRFK